MEKNEEPARSLLVPSSMLERVPVYSNLFLLYKFIINLRTAISQFSLYFTAKKSNDNGVHFSVILLFLQELSDKRSI